MKTKNSSATISAPAQMQDAASAVELLTKLALSANELVLRIREKDAELAALRAQLGELRAHYKAESPRLNGALSALETP